MGDGIGCSGGGWGARCGRAGPRTVLRVAVLPASLGSGGTTMTSSVMRVSSSPTYGKERSGPRLVSCLSCESAERTGSPARAWLRNRWWIEALAVCTD